MFIEKELPNLAESNKSQLKGILKTLIAINTVNPPGNETLLVNEVAKIFKKQKIKYKIFSKSKNRANIVATIGKGKKELLFAVHSDTVPANPKSWNTNPFNLVEKKGKFYGRGVEDNKGPAASAILAFLLLKRYEKCLRYRISLAILADEERGSKYGMKYLLESKKIMPDYAIVLDIDNNMKAISIGEKGILRLKIMSFGKAAHASNPKEGVNAIANASALINEIKNFKFGHKNSSKKLFSGPTLNIGTIKGGSAINVVPDCCEFTLDIRYLPNQDPKKIICQIKKIASRIASKNKKSKCKFRFKLLSDEKPFEEAEDNVLVGLLCEAVSKTLGFKPKVIGLSGGTDTRRLVHFGINAIGYGAGNHQAHKNNESIEIKQLLDLSKVILLLSLTFSEKLS